MPRSWKTPKRRKSSQRPGRGQVWQDVLEPDTLVVVHGIRHREWYTPGELYVRDVIFVEDGVLCYQPEIAFIRDYRFTGGTAEVPPSSDEVLPGRYVYVS